MNKALKLGGFAAGGGVIFTASFIIFAAMSGVPMHKIAVLSNFVEAPPESEEPGELGTEQAPDVAPRKNDKQVVQASMSVLDTFMIESPFDAAELAALQKELKDKLRDLDDRQLDIMERDRRVRDREEALESRWEELMNLRAALDEFESEIHARGQELERDESAHKERERLSWKKLSKAFVDGETSELIPRLLQYEPEDAARILNALEDERASELLRGFSPDKSFEYWEAYRTHRDQ